VRIVVTLRGKLADLDRDLATIEQGVKGGFNEPLNADVKAAHRAAHKPGVPSKIEADPEVKGFIQARIETHTFDAVVDAVKANFPPDRHVSRSSLHRWYKRNSRFILAMEGKT
jgi:hypothetical protein